mmetsp:Transcript_22612/g.70771  ORF Transcript_22612/g.70771 Transcript_22612/m.70771 type:complete len:106 (-) Transcript_22612:3833-4150(-)
MEERVIEYFSRSLPAAMRSYDSRRLELIGVLTALEYFRVYIEGRQTKLETDHANLRFYEMPSILQDNWRGGQFVCLSSTTNLDTSQRRNPACKSVTRSRATRSTS